MKNYKKKILAVLMFSTLFGATTTQMINQQIITVQADSKSTSSSSSSSNDSSDDTTDPNAKPDLDDYDIENNSQYRLRSINTDSATLWNQSDSGDTEKTGDTSGLNGQLVKITQVANDDDGNAAYFYVQGLGPTNGGKNLGWISASALSTVSDYELPFTYSSQLYPTYAPDACEAVSLLMILSVRGLATNVSTKSFIDGIPRSTNPNLGYTADPYRHGSHATIYPAGLAKYAKKWTNNVYDITGASLSKLIYEIRHGNPVVFEGSWRMQNTKSDHISALVGYKPGYFEVADPYMRQNSKNKVFWTSTSNFMKLFNTSYRGSRACVLK